MIQKLQKRLHQPSDDGFTLIELLVVIVILAVLAAVVVFSVSGLTNNSKTSACKSDVATINTAAEAYYATVGTPVADLYTLTQPISATAGSFLHPDPLITAAAANTKTVVSNGVTQYVIKFTPSATTNLPGDAAGTLGATATTC